jgi:hypothetical protein
MHNLDDHPTPPEVPKFSAALEAFLAQEVRDGLPSHRTGRPSRARTYALAGVAAAAVVVAVVVFAVSVGHGSAPSQNAGNETPPVHLAAFSVDPLPGGRIALTLPQNEIFDPVAVTAALRKAGVPALVTVGSVCTVPGSSPVLGDVISAPMKEANGQTLTTITPSAIPAGQELSFGYYHVPGGGGLHVALVPLNAHLSCTPGPPPIPHGK